VGADEGARTARLQSLSQIENCVPAKETYGSAKEPCVSAKKALHICKGVGADEGV